MNKTFDYILYHSPCNDGFGGAFVAWLCNKNAFYIGLNSRNEFPMDLLDTLRDKRVIMIDIAFSRDIMIEINKIASRFVVLDHHETNQEALKGLDFAKFDMTKSGCVMTWEFFFPIEPLPDFLRYIGLKDIWKHKDVLEALYFTTAFPGTQTFEVYNEYYTNHSLVIDTIKKGSIQHNFMMQIVKQVSSRPYDCIWHGYPTKIVNVGYPLSSDVGDWLSSIDPQCVVLLWTKQVGEPYNYSLRSNSNDGPNVATIAKLYKGGGHAHAGGFKSDLSPDELIK